MEMISRLLRRVLGIRSRRREFVPSVLVDAALRDSLAEKRER
jgi:hypothetical protein